MCICVSCMSFMGSRKGHLFNFFLFVKVRTWYFPKLVTVGPVWEETPVPAQPSSSGTLDEGARHGQGNGSETVISQNLGAFKVNMHRALKLLRRQFPIVLVRLS